jgi:glycosyltransferase involved in cell wall biosynthesis
MWTHLFAGLVGKEDMGFVVYSNGKRCVEYRKNFLEIWIDSFKKEKITGNIDVIVARGGFKEYVPLLKKFPNVRKIYYGANHGCIPEDSIKYDLILCDSEMQVRKCQKYGLNGKLFIKPAPPHFRSLDINKKYDVGFSAIWPKDKRKNVAWVHKTAPKRLKILQMGHEVKAPSNILVKYIKHNHMVKAINKCKVVIAPYTKEDSCPRIISEAIACNVPVVALDSCQFWRDKYPVNVVPKNNFWYVVKELLKVNKFNLRKIYEQELSVSVASRYLREVILNGNDLYYG